MGTIQGADDHTPLFDSVTVQMNNDKKPVPPDSKHWEAAGKGRLIQDLDEVPDAGFTQGFIDAQHHHLGQIAATAISGNDITSSCLYVAGLSAVGAGKFAPISLLLVVVVLWLFKGLYPTFLLYQRDVLAVYSMMSLPLKKSSLFLWTFHSRFTQECTLKLVLLCH